MFDLSTDSRQFEPRSPTWWVFSDISLELMTRLPCYPRAFGNGPLNFKPWSSDEDELRALGRFYGHRSLLPKTGLQRYEAQTRDTPATSPLPCVLIYCGFYEFYSE
ncbi:hypothetical protein TNCV_1289001 [Trichonephila clavipes]|nr:hypothetical protein TNCV_1289001 [Trichonephila clavipes]